MADSVKQKTTAKERQIARIEQLKKQLQNEEAKLRAEARKERNAQLIAFGIFFEHGLLEANQENFDGFIGDMKNLLRGKTLEHALAGAERLAKERQKLATKKETSSEPTEQLPEPPVEKKVK